MTSLYLAIGPDHDDYTIIKAKTKKIAIKKFKKNTPLENSSNTEVENCIDFIKVKVI